VNFFCQIKNRKKNINKELMKPHQYKLSFIGIARRSIVIWFFLIVYIAITVLVLTFEETFYNKLGTLLIWNFCCLFIFFPGFLLHFAYISSGINKTILIDTEAIIVLKRGREIKRIKRNEIERIIKVHTLSWVRSIWEDHYYYKIIDNEGETLKINCYFFKDGDRWQNHYFSKNQNHLLSTKEVFLPLQLCSKYNLIN